MICKFIMQPVDALEWKEINRFGMEIEMKSRVDFPSLSVVSEKKKDFH